MAARLHGNRGNLQRFTLFHIDSVPLDGGFLDTPTQYFSINYAPDLREQRCKRWTVRWGRGRAYNIGSSAVAWWNMIANLRVDDTQRSLIGLGVTLQERFIWDVSAQLRLTGTLSVAYNPSLSEG